MTNSTSLPTPWESLLAGCISGMVAISICHPLDVIRTELQLKPAKLKDPVIFPAIRQHGLKFLYSGFWLPFYAQGFYKSIIFTTNTASKQYIFNDSSSTTYGVLGSGFIAGMVNALAVAPVEMIRTRQILSKGNSNYQSSKSIRECVRDVIGESGPFGLWRGYMPTALRDGPGIGLYLLAFEKMKEILIVNSISNSSLDNNVCSKSIGNSQMLWIRIVSGSAAGVAFWLWALPIDTVKTLIESSKGTSFNSSLRKQIAEEGLQKLVRSFPAAIGRGIPSAAVTLTTYDMLIEGLINSK